MKFTVSNMINILQKYPQDAEMLQPGDHGEFHFLGEGSVSMKVLLEDDGTNPYDNDVGEEDHYDGDDIPEDFAEWRRVLVFWS